jgi:hypothetical protein
MIAGAHLTSNPRAGMVRFSTATGRLIMRAKTRPRAQRGELMLGVCIGLAIVTDLLIGAEIIERDHLTSRITEAIMLARGDRQVPLRAMLWLLDQFESAAEPTSS